MFTNSNNAATKEVEKTPKPRCQVSLVVCYPYIGYLIAINIMLKCIICGYELSKMNITKTIRHKNVTTTGSPVEAYKRLQFNIQLHPYKKVPFMKDLPETLLPIFWIEESVALNATYVNQLKDLFKVMKIVNVAKWVILMVSMIGIGVGGLMHFKKGTQVNITPVSKTRSKTEQRSNTTSVISMVHSNSLNGNGLDENKIRHGHEFERY